MNRALLSLLLILAFETAEAQDLFNKARAALGARDTAGAVAAFGDALKAGQKTSEVNYYLGAIAFAQGRLEEAAGYLETSIRQDDDRLDAFKVLAETYLAKKEAGKGLATLQRAARLAPKDCDVAISYGRALLAADSVDQAIVYLTRAKECAPGNGAIYEGLGDAYGRQNVVVLAITNYQKACELEPQNLEARYKLARALEKNRQFTEAVREYRAAQAIDSTFADPYFQEGRIFVLAKQPKNAVPALRTFVRLQPASVEGRTFLVRALFSSEDWAGTVTEAKDLLGRDSSSADVWRAYAYALVETKDFAAGLSALRSLERRDTLDAADYVKFGEAHLGLKQEPEALAAFEAATTADSTNCDPHFSLGFLYMKQQQYEPAAARFERAIVCNPRSLSAYVNAAASYMQTKNFGRSRELLSRSIELKSDFFQGRLWLARYFVQVDSFDLAEKEYQEVLTLIGDNTEKYRKEAGEAHGLLGSLYVTRQQWSRGAESFRRAAGFGYETGATSLAWGQAILQTLDPALPRDENQRRTEEGVKRFRRAVELEPSNAQAHLWLAEGLIRSRIEGDDERNRDLKREACEEYRKVLRLEPRNEDAKKGMERVGC